MDLARAKSPKKMPKKIKTWKNATLQEPQDPRYSDGQKSFLELKHSLMLPFKKYIYMEPYLGPKPSQMT